MVPKFNNITFLNLLCTLDCQLYYICKIANEDLDKQIYTTYLLPTGRLLGFMSTYLNFAKNNSHGATSYEYGPRNMNGIFSSSRLSKVYRDE